MFDVNSRYYALENDLLTTPQDNVIAFKKRRFLPALNSRSDIRQITYIEGDRLDLIAARNLGDPLIYWQIVDINPVLHPKHLTAEIGQAINISLTPVEAEATI